MARIRHKMNKVYTGGNARGAIYEQMKNGNWYTLNELAFVAGISEAGASARIRDLRKPQFGGHTIETTPAYGGTPWLYRMEK